MEVRKRETAKRAAKPGRKVGAGAPKANVPSSGVDDTARPNDLRFDSANPRMPLMKFDTDGEAVRFMLENYDVDELVRSILVTGWLDYEPLIVEKPTLEVLEGNRRLAALKLIASADLRAEANYKL